MPHRRKSRRLSQTLLCETPLFFLAFGIGLNFLPPQLWHGGFKQVSDFFSNTFWSPWFMVWGILGYTILYCANMRLWRVYLGASIFAFSFIGWSCFGAGWTGFAVYNCLAFSTALKYLGLTPGLTVLRED